MNVNTDQTGRRWTRRRLISVYLLLAVVFVLSVCCSRIMNEVIPRRAVVTPILSMDVDLLNPSPQSKAFSLKYYGRHSVNVDLELRRGPQGLKPHYEHFLLAGDAEILDASGQRLFGKTFERTFIEYEDGAVVFDFDASDVVVGEEMTFIITLNLAPEFTEHYSDEMSLYIKKELKYSILD